METMLMLLRLACPLDLNIVYYTILRNDPLKNSYQQEAKYK